MTTTGATYVSALEGGNVRSFEVTPEEAGLTRANAADLKGGDPAHNAAALRAVLDGAKSAYRDIAVFNAAAALVVADKAQSLKDGAAMAARAIDSGRARAVLERLIDVSNRG